MLAQPLTSPSFAAFYGEKYEAAAIAKLLNGGTFDCSTGTQVPGGGVRIPPSERCAFTDAGDLARVCMSRQGQASLYVPSSGSYTAVDAVLPGNILVNFTIDVRHPVTGQQAGNARTLKQFFVCVPFAFAWGEK